MSSGTVRKWIDGRGFGFILSDSGDELFVHCRNVIGSMDKLREGQRVRFEERPSERHQGKLEAISVHLCLIMNADLSTAPLNVGTLQIWQP